MKFLKIFFSRTLVVVLLFLIQLALMFVTLMVLEVFTAVQIVSALVALLVLLHMVNKKENPEFKIPWLILLALFPLFTIVTYILFAHPRMTKKESKRAMAIYEETNKCMGRRSGDYGEYNGIGKYLSKNAYLPGSTDSKTTYFRSGEAFFDDLISELEKAEHFIFMEYFIINHGTMWYTIHNILKKKVEQGVEVKLMYDDIGTVGELKAGYYKKLRGEGIDCYKFNPFRPIVSGVHNNRDHRKITVIDGKVGFTGGINIGDEYINKRVRFGHWKDTAIKVEGSAVDNLTALFLQMFDMNAKRAPKDYEKYFNASHEKFDGCGFVHVFGDGPKPYYMEQVGEVNYINLINAAKRYCYITTPYLIPDYNLAMALRSAAFRGVDVRIITPHIPDKKVIFNITRSNYKFLREAGVRIYEYIPGFIHAKMLVADDEYAFVGTINLDYRSLVHHYECGATICNAPCIKDIKDDIDQTIAVSGEITDENFKMNKLASLLNAVFNIFSPML